MAKQIIMDGKNILKLNSHETKQWKKFELDGHTYTWENEWHVTTGSFDKGDGSAKVRRVYSDSGVEKEFPLEEIITCVQSNKNDDVVIATATVADPRQQTYNIKIYLNGKLYSRKNNTSMVRHMAADLYGNFWWGTTSLFKVDPTKIPPVGQEMENGTTNKLIFQEGVTDLNDIACTKTGKVLIATNKALYRYNPSFETFDEAIIHSTWADGSFPMFMTIDGKNNLIFADAQNNKIVKSGNADGNFSVAKNTELYKTSPVRVQDIWSLDYAPDGSIFYSVKTGEIYKNNLKIYSPPAAGVTISSAYMLVDVDGNWYAAESGVIKNGSQEWAIPNGATYNIASPKEYGAKSGNWETTIEDTGDIRIIEPIVEVSIPSVDYASISTSIANLLTGNYNEVAVVVQMGQVSADSEWNKIPFGADGSYAMTTNDRLHLQAVSGLEIGTNNANLIVKKYIFKDTFGHQLTVDTYGDNQSHILNAGFWVTFKQGALISLAPAKLTDAGTIDSKMYTDLTTHETAIGTEIVLTGLNDGGKSILNNFITNKATGEMKLVMLKDLEVKLKSKEGFHVKQSFGITYDTGNTAYINLGTPGTEVTLTFKKDHTYLFSYDTYGIVDLGKQSADAGGFDTYVIQNTKYTQSSSFEGDQGIQEFGFFNHDWSDLKGTETKVVVWLKSSILPWDSVKGVKIMDSNTSTAKITIMFDSPQSVTWRTHVKWEISKTGVRNIGAY